MDENNDLPDLNLEVGDIVEAFGLRGEVDRVDPDSEYFQVIVRFSNEIIERFFNDGRLFAWHKTPSLKLIEKKNKPKKKIKLYKHTIYSNGHCRQTNWSSSSSITLSGGENLVMIEEHEVEVDE